MKIFVSTSAVPAGDVKVGAQFNLVQGGKAVTVKDIKKQRSAGGQGPLETYVFYTVRGAGKRVNKMKYKLFRTKVTK